MYIYNNGLNALLYLSVFVGVVGDSVLVRIHNAGVGGSSPPIATTI
jgi:hypothetical protein